VGLAAVTYTVFSAAMALGRLAGDHLAERFGSVRLIRLSAGVTAGGFAGALVVARVWTGLVAFAILGAGLSIIVPLVFTSTSQLGQTAESRVRHLVWLLGDAGRARIDRRTR
jgi:MFS family permease